MNYLQAHMVKANSVEPLVIKKRDGEFATASLYDELTAEQKSAVFVAYQLYQAFRFKGTSLSWGAIQFKIDGITDTDTQAEALARTLIHLGLLRFVAHNGQISMYAISAKGVALVEAIATEDHQHA
jgi:hypothetical protein